VFRDRCGGSVPSRDLRTITESLFGRAPPTRDTEPLSALVGQRLSLQISNAFKGPDGAIEALVLDPHVEEMFRRSLREIAAGSGGALDPEQARKLGLNLEAAMARLSATGRSPCLITSPDIRRYLRAFAERRCPSLAVLSFRELEPDASIRPFETVSLS